MPIRKAPAPKAPIYEYSVKSDKVGAMLGPHKVGKSGDGRTVHMTEAQAQYWIDQGMVDPLQETAEQLQAKEGRRQRG